MIKIDINKKLHGSNGEMDLNIDIDIKDNDFVALAGESGSGKTTLLRILAGLEEVKGTIKIGDKIWLNDKINLPPQKREIGFVFQFHNLLPEFNALENTLMPALIKGMNAKEACERAEAILTRVGLGDRLRHHVGELSGGEQQRVAVARSLVLKPSILLADEPTGNLDARTGESIHDLLISLNRDEGITAVVVTHNLKLADKLSRRVTLIDGKAVLAD